MPPNGLELSCPAEAGKHLSIVAHAGGPGAPPYPPARRPKVLAGFQDRRSPQAAEGPVSLTGFFRRGQPQVLPQAPRSGRG